MLNFVPEYLFGILTVNIYYLEIKMKNIVIIGAGYGGVAAALALEKQFRKPEDYSITLIDRHSYHLFAPNLYEIGTAEEELATIDQLKKTITVPLTDILKHTRISFLQSEVTSIDAAAQFVQAGTKKIHFDQLVVALGSQSDYFGIPGAEQFSLPLKTFGDGLKIRNAVEFAIELHRMDVNKKNIRLVVAGGGYTGVEFAAELAHELEFVAWKNGYPPEKIEISIVEATNSLIPGFSPKVSLDALRHLKQWGVRVLLSSPIQKVDEHNIYIQNGDTLAYDVLIWTTGVKAVALPFVQPINTDRKGRIVTNNYLQSDKYNHIYAVGDSGCVINIDGRPAPPTAEDAIDQGRYVGKTIPLLMRNLRPTPYKGHPHGYIITLGGRYAVLNYAGIYLKGWLAYIVRVCVHFNYYSQVVGIWKAAKYALFDWNIYGRND